MASLSCAIHIDRCTQLQANQGLAALSSNVHASHILSHRPSFSLLFRAVQ